MDPTLLKRPPSTSCNCWNGSAQDESGKCYRRRRFWQWHKKWRHSKQQYKGWDERGGRGFKRGFKRLRATLANPILANFVVMCCCCLCVVVGVGCWVLLVWVLFVFLLVCIVFVCVCCCVLLCVFVVCCCVFLFLVVVCCRLLLWFVWCLLLFVVVVVVRVGGVVVGLDHPSAGFRRLPPDRPKCRSFFPLPALIFALHLSHCVSSRGISVVFLKAGTCSCARPPGLHTTDRELQK